MHQTIEIQNIFLIIKKKSEDKFIPSDYQKKINLKFN